ncbi:MAG: hypothetical protein ACP5NC_07935 [Nitrososphaeria archaeon]
MFPAFILIIALGYYLLYRSDPLRAFHPCRRSSWNSVLGALGINYTVHEEGRKVWFAVCIAGSVLVVLGIFSPSFRDGILMQFLGSIALIMAMPLFLGLPANTSRETVLPYPRRANSCLPEIRHALPVNPAPASPSFSMFYYGLKDAHIMSIPVAEVPLVDQFITYLEASQRHAFIQIHFRGANPQKYLEYLKWKLLHDRELATVSPLWLSTIEDRVKRINMLLASHTYEVSVFGIIEGDPYEMQATASDEIDHIAPFETLNPAVFYWLVKHDRPPFRPPNYFGHRVEPPFFYATTTTLSSFVSIPAHGRTLEFAGEKLEVINPWGVREEAPGMIQEATRFPRYAEKVVSMPIEGAIDVYSDGERVRIFVSDYAAKFYRQNGVVLEPNTPAFDEWFRR